MSQEEWNENLIAAVNRGMLEYVKHCVDNKADINCYTRNGNTPLAVAVSWQNESIVEYLLSLGADVNKFGEPSGQPPLVKAVECNSTKCIKILLDNNASPNVIVRNDTRLINAVKQKNSYNIERWLNVGADINYLNSQGYTALAIAVEQKDLDTIKFLIEHNADVLKFGETGKSPLSIAISQSNFEMIDYLISKGANFNDVDLENALSNAIKDGNLKMVEFLIKKFGIFCKFHQSPLAYAALCGHLEIVKFLLSEGPFVNEVDSYGNTALMNAVEDGNEEIVKCLIQHGADVCKHGMNGRTPLSIAVENQNLSLITYLLEQGAAGTITTAFLAAIDLGNSRIAKYLVEKGASYEDKKNVYLMKCIEKGMFLMVKFLVSLGTNLDSIGACGHTALTKAVKVRDFAVVKYLAEQGANVDQIDAYNKTASSTAMDLGYTEIAKYLLLKGANIKHVSEPEDKKSSELMQCVEKGDVVMVKFLSEIANLDLISPSGYTPLTKAVEMENFEMVKCLVESGSSIDQFDGRNNNALKIASSKFSFRIVKFLIESGADVELARREIDNYANISHDLANYLKMKRKNDLQPAGTGQEESDI